jgi:hypothetical protein
MAIFKSDHASAAAADLVKSSDRARDLQRSYEARTTFASRSFSRVIVFRRS